MRQRTDNPEPTGAQSTLAITRWVAHPDVPASAALARAHPGPGDVRIPLGDVGELRLLGPFTRRGKGPLELWSARARLYGRGPRVARFARVEVDVAVWGEGESEVTVRPARRRVLAWGARREWRYFELAHRAADHIAGVLTSPARSSLIALPAPAAARRISPSAPARVRATA